ncbi:MAG: SpoIID/LytB domain-containing protein [Bacteroidota bacterium]
MSRLLSILAAICFLPCLLSGQMVEVKISPADKLTAFTYQSLGDKVIVTTADSFPRYITELNTLESIEVSARGTEVRLMQADKEIGRYESVLFWTNDPQQRFKLHYKRTVRTYAGQLRVGPGTRSLELVNHVYMEDYIKGVIHAEAGHHKSLDFFKVQALSARTYALSNLNRHRKNGYDVCDNTHCQAYKGAYKSAPLIDQAVEETIREVIVFNENQLIEAVFSANCGGYTANSEDVWIANVAYLRGTPDYDYCEGTYNHAWHLTLPKLDFLAKIGRYLKVEATRFEVIPDQSGRVRRIYVNGDPKLTISGEEVRRLFRFKSSKFHLYDAQSLLFVEGHGFGHGVGMCQDGAYFLSETGMDYVDILKHYYKGIKILPVNEVDGIW